MECLRPHELGASTQPRRVQRIPPLCTGSETAHPAAKARAPSPPGLCGRRIED